MRIKRSVDTALYILTAALLIVALALTFTVSDYYIFNKFSAFNPLFIISQWVKKAGLLLLPLAVFLKKKGCAQAAKYILPIFTVISCFTYGNFFELSRLAESIDPTEQVYASINEFISPACNRALFFTSCGLNIAICILLFLRDGFGFSMKGLVYGLVAFVAVTPLNVFENFYNRNIYDKFSPEFAGESFLLFGNFTIWHLITVVLLVAITIAYYYFLRNKPRDRQDDYLIATAIVLLIHYHSKDSVIMGDGYNVYRTVFACVPLFICNIGVYVASLSVILKKKILYAISFFVHAAGAVSVFVYFGRDETTNLGIICSYSLLFFCLTHCLLFVLTTMPTALGHYNFKPKDAIIPLCYYMAVIVVASVMSAIVTSASMEFTYGGYTLGEGEWIRPNYAFTQQNPLPFEVPFIPIKIWRYELSLLYVLGLYAFYVGIFYAFNAAYYCFLGLRKVFYGRKQPSSAALGEVATTDEE